MNEQGNKKAGYKMTRPRRAVLDYLEKVHEPSSAQEIHEQVSNIDLASIYRTLGLFEKLNIVQREDIAGTARFYLADCLHHHITCSSCGRIECIPCQHSFSKIKGFKKITHQLTLSGICSGCVN